MANCASPRMNTGIERIVTTGLRPVVTMRIGADHWPSNTGTVGAVSHGLVREPSGREDSHMRHLTLRAWRKLRLTEKAVPSGDRAIARESH